MHAQSVIARVAALVACVAIATATIAADKPNKKRGGREPSAATSRYRGELISLHLRDAELKDVVHAFATILHVNIAVDPNVSGTVTIDLVDVPWDQALDLILAQHGLTRQVERNVSIVTPLK